MIKILKQFKGLNNRGVTLPEMIVVVLLFGILSTVAFNLLLAGSSSFEHNKAKTELQQELRKAVDWLKEDLRQTGSAGITTPSSGVTASSITFRQSTGATGGTISWSGNTIQYLLGGTGGNQLQRITGGSTRVIASNIIGLSFNRTDPTLIVISLGAQKNAIKGGMITINYSFKVRVRN